MPQVKWSGTWSAPMTQVVASMQRNGNEPQAIQSALKQQFGKQAPSDVEVVQRKMLDLYFTDKMDLTAAQMDQLNAMPDPEQKRKPGHKRGESNDTNKTNEGFNANGALNGTATASSSPLSGPTTFEPAKRQRRQ